MWQNVKLPLRKICVYFQSLFTVWKTYYDWKISLEKFLAKRTHQPSQSKTVTVYTRCKILLGRQFICHVKCICLSKIAFYSVSKTDFYFSSYCKTTYEHIIEG